MKRLLSTAAAALLLVLAAPEAGACEIGFEQVEVVADEKGEAKVVALIELEHRNCVLEDHEVNVDVEGAEKLSAGPWRREGRSTLRGEVRVRLKGDEARVRVWRECAKKGVSEASARVRKK